MPRIDPIQLLKTLSVLLAPHGGIKSSEEVSRLVQLMQKFSKKLVSKIIYVKILKSSSSELLDKFLNEKGWDLLNYWFADAIKTNNWPLCAELTQLFNQCPITAQRLKENVDQNVAPRLIRQLSCDVRVDATVRQIAVQVLNKWMAVVQTPPEGPSGSLRTTRGMRNVIITNTLANSSLDNKKVQVIAHTSTEEIVNLGNMTVSSGAQASLGDNTVTTDVMTGSDGHTWVGKGGKFKSPMRGAGGSRSIMAARQKGAPPPGRSKEIIESDDDSDDDFKPVKDPFDAILGNGVTKPNKTKPMNTHNGFGIIRNETLDVDDLIDGQSDEDKPVKLLAGMANELSESLKKEVVDEIKKEEKDVKSDAERQKEKERRREKERQREKDERRDKDRHKDKYKDKHRDKDRDREKEKRRDEERRRRDKEREREKEKERKEKKRESKPYRETELRGGIDSSEKQRIKELAQRMREENTSKKEEFKPASLVAGLARIPKIPKKEEEKKEVKDMPLPKKGTSFEDIMFAMDTTAKPMKAPPIKNKNKDLLESFSSSGSGKPLSKTTSDSKLKSVLPKSSEYLLQVKTEDKTKGIVRADSGSKISKTEEKNASTDKGLELRKDEKKEEDKKPLDKKPDESKILEKNDDVKAEDKKAVKRPSTDSECKIKVKPPAQLVESSMFGDFLSTIMPEAPKKKKIKLSDLKAQKEAKANAENIMKPEEEAEKPTEEKQAAPLFSFYREVTEEEENAKGSPERECTSPESDSLKDPSKSPSQEGSVHNDDVEMPFTEPECDLPREVRGILVYTKGPKRTRRIQWRPEAELVEVEYFELDETERVNVNKLKFEEQRKRELELEKNAMHKKASGKDDGRPWPEMKKLDISEEQLPDIDYGGNSNEKKEQQQRENTVLQALFFNNTLPNNPVEPDAAGGTRGETKPIPLDDKSGDADFKDYAHEDWPIPVQDNYTIKDASPSPGAEIMNSIQPNVLHPNMGSGGPISDMGGSTMDEALYNAQKAAQETLRKQGLYDREDYGNMPMDQNIPPPFGGKMGPEMMDYDNFPQGPPDFPNHMNEMHFPTPMDGNWGRGGPLRGGPHGGPMRNGHMGPEFNRGGHGGGPRGFPPMGPRGPMGPMPPRGFPPMNKHNGGFDRNRENFNNRNNHHNNHHRRDDRRDHNSGKKDFRRPCKFWVEQGFCREENRCKFPHPAR